MKLSDGDICGRLHSGELKIEPLDVNEQLNIEKQIEQSEQIQPASVDLSLGDTLRVYNDVDVIDTQDMPEPDDTRTGERLELQPGEFAIASTKETIQIPNDLSAEVKGRSSVGRAGFHVHTAGWVDPGFTGQITLELANHTNATVVLYEGMRVCQMVFDTLSSPAVVGYGEKSDAKYQGQTGPTASRLNEDWGEPSE